MRNDVSSLKTRSLALFSPHIHLRTGLEWVYALCWDGRYADNSCRRFLHTTWLGRKIVDFWWHGVADSSVRPLP